MKCSICQDFGFTKSVEDGEEIWSMCECKKKKETEEVESRKLVEAYIPKEYWEYTMEDYLKIPLMKQVREFNAPSIEIIKSCVNSPGYFIDNYKILWIWGPDINSCHTTLSVIIGKSLISQGKKIRFIKMQSLIDMFMKDFENKESTANLMKYDVIILDDALDVSRCFISEKTNYTKILIFNFLTSFINEGKKFICTSNTDISGIDNRFNEIRTILLRYAFPIEIRGDITFLMRKG
jgi:hypothetical protein